MTAGAGCSVPSMPRAAERELAVRVLHRLPMAVTRRLRPRLVDRYATAANPVVQGRTRLGHRLRLDLRSSVQATAYFSGRYDDRLIMLAQQLLRRPGGVALDIGANIGWWTVPLAHVTTDTGGHVVAFEPVPSNRRRLAENLALNGVADVAHVLPMALSDEHGTAEMSLREEFALGSSTGNAALVIADGSDRRFASTPVSTVPLDALQEIAAADIVVIKIDVEGHEDSVLRGAVAMLRRARPTIIAEWNPVYYARRRVDPTASVDAVLAEVDYVVARETEEGWRVVDGFHSPKDLDNVLLVPKEKSHDITALANRR